MGDEIFIRRHRHFSPKLSSERVPEKKEKCTFSMVVACLLSPPSLPSVRPSVTRATIESLRYTFFWLKWFLNDGGSLTQNKVYLFLAEMVSD